MGVGWRHNYDHSLVRDLSNGVPAMLMNRADGGAYRFEWNGSNFVRGSGFVSDVLTELKDQNGTVYGWKYVVASDSSIEQYNAYGQLISIKPRQGGTIKLQYTATTTTPGRLILITSNFGAQIILTYDNVGRVNSFRIGGRKFSYDYDSNNNLVKVTFPDTKMQQYLYNESGKTSGTSLPNALTGIIDENNARYATYFYDAQGRAIAENLGGGVNQYTLNFNADGSTGLTDPLGTTRVIQFSSYFNRLKNTGRSQPGGAGCGPAFNASNRDANGNLSSSTDFNGVTTNFAYDLSRNLETSRIEAAGTAQARKVSTIWHSTFHLPLQIDEAMKRTTYTYDANGNVLVKTEQATNDVNGFSGAAAAVVGTPRNWTYTYNSFGQVTSATGPRTDILDQTSYAYLDANLYSVTNAVGHVTTMSNFDSFGHPTVITDPNGLVSTLVYSPRGWLVSRSVTINGQIETTTYSYDGVGQLVQVTMPDTSQIHYTYDTAHRLTTITDHLGNSVNYGLDNMGNRISETITDTSGTLTRRITRVYDALNRLKEITGGAE